MKQKQKKKKKSHIPIRMNILFFAVFVLFSILILRLGVVQIVKGEEFSNQVEQKDEISVDFSVPRGEIYDRNYLKVVSNVPQKAITYTPPKNPQPKELLEISKKLAQLIQMPAAEIDKKVTERDLKDIWLLENDNGSDKITKEEEELFRQEKLTNSDIYKLKLERITDAEMSTIDKNVAAIYRKLYSAVALTPTIVKNENVTDEEFALVSENLENLPGVDITIDWERSYPYNYTFRNILGGVTSADEGLPADKLLYYSSKGYSLNDRVGKSYIEELYEDVLKGQKSKVKTVTDKNGNVVESQVISEGSSGKDIVLTVDMELQAEVEKIVEEQLLAAMQMPRTDTLDSAFVVMMDPRTGEILSLVGKQYDREEKVFLDYTHGTFTAAFEPGSVVKGATVLTGYQTGVISETNNRQLDEVLHIKGTEDKKSVRVMGWINDLTALERSSNVYMWKIAIAIMNGQYIPNGPLPLNEEKIETIRYYFSQFGLGTKTGIGFENEIDGLKGYPEQEGNYIDIAIGQLDTYTPIQLAQYVSTIANDGYRMKPQLVKEIREPDENGDGLGTVIEEVQPAVLNKIDMKEEWIERVQQGFWQVFHGSQGTARGYFQNESYNAAGKTGTAQSYKNGKATYNITLVGYAPFENPEVAMAVVVPNAYYGEQTHSSANIIGQKIMRKYFELKEQRLNENKANSENASDAESMQAEGNNPEAETDNASDTAESNE